MDNGVSITEDAKFGERPPSNSDVLDNFEQGRVDLTSDELKDMDGLETVEETVEAERPAIDSEKPNSPEFTNVEVSGTVEEEKDGSDLSREVYKFEEVIQSSDGEQISDEFSAKAELFTRRTHSDDKQIGADEVAKDDDNILMGGSTVESVSTVGDGRVDYVKQINKTKSGSEIKDGDTYSEKSGNGFVHQESMNSSINRADMVTTDADVAEENSIKTMIDVEDGNQILAGGLRDSSVAVPNGNASESNYQEAVGSESVVLGSTDQQEKLKSTLANLNLESREHQAETQAKDSIVLDTSDSTDVEKDNVDTQDDSAVAAGPNLEFAEVEKSCSSDFSTELSQSVSEGHEHEADKTGKKQDSSGIRDAEIQPSKIPSSGSSSTSGLTTLHSSGPIIREPVSQDTSSTNREYGTAVDVLSSSNVITPNSSGVKSPEPALRANESTPRSTAVRLPPNNVTSATPARPAGLGRAAPLLDPASRMVQQPRGNGSTPQAQNQIIEESTNGDSEEYDETREKLQMIRVKFLRLAHRLGQTPHNVVVAQVLYRLGLAEQLRGRSGGRVAAFSFDRASAMAEQLETAGHEPLDFTCTILVLGKSGVGKSATINSIFDEVMFHTDAFRSGTNKVQEIVGTVQGIKVRVIDTPGLLTSWLDQPQNEKILRSVKRFINKAPPDIVLYLDRLDMQSRDSSDMPLLRTITEIFGPSIWFNAIVVLTHASSAPPEGPDGTATGYDMFVTQRSHVVQQAIRQAAGDMRLMNPISLVENHSACRTNRAGQRVLPNGQIWKPHLLLLSFASKILAEANLLLKLQDTVPGTPFAPRTRSPPLPFLLSSLLQSRSEVKLPSDQFDDGDDIDDDLDECSDSEEESEYDELPPFRSLTKAQLQKLTKTERKAYYAELEYREKLFMKKQLKEERKQRKMMRKLQEEANSLPAEYSDNAEEGTGGTASVPVPMPDLALPASFDSDNPTYRYRSLDSSSSWLVRAVMEPNGWDHDIGYDGINVERLFVVKEKVPVSFSGHISKDKKDASLQMEVASSVKHGKGKATSFGFDMQSVGKDLAYTLRGESRFSNRRINKAAVGFSATVMGDVLTGGIKLEDKLVIGKRGQVVVSGGAIYGRGDVACGGSLEATLRDKDHPLGRFLATLGLSVMDWHGDLAIGCNSQMQIPIGRHSNLICRVNINNRGSGQFSVRINSSEQLQIVLVGLIPLVQRALSYFFDERGQ